jgi:hypothetical protein
MSKVVQDPHSNLHVLFGESLELPAATSLASASSPLLDSSVLRGCQLHWYIGGDSHRASRPLKVSPGAGGSSGGGASGGSGGGAGTNLASTSLKLDFCTCFVADVGQDVDLKLTIAQGSEHLGVYFGHMSDLGREEAFQKYELELRNVDGVVATAIVFTAVQRRWTLGEKAATRRPGECTVVGSGDPQAHYVGNAPSNY